MSSAPIRLHLIYCLGQRSLPGRAAALVLASLLSALPVSAQDGGRSQTELQDEAEASIRAVCSGLAQLNAQEALVGLEVDLFRRCNEMIETANEIDGVTDPSRIDASLGLTGFELAAAWQQLAGEEAATQGALGTEVSESQLDNLSARISAIRRGTTGVTLADLGFRTPRGTVRLADIGVPFLSLSGGDSAGETDADADAERWGLFLNGTFGFGDKVGTGREDAFDVDTTGLTVGLDYRFSSSFVAGVAAGTASVHADLLSASSGAVSGGGVDTAGTSLSLYFTSFGEKFYLDGSVVFGSDDYDMERRIVYTSRTSRDAQDRLVTASTDGSRTSVSLGAGYDGQAGALRFGPYSRLSSMRIEIDGYTEDPEGAAELALVVDGQEIDSLVSILGFELGRAFSTESGVFVLQGSAEWNHEFDDDPRTIGAHYVFDPNELPFNIFTDEPDRDYFLASIGIVGVLPRGWQGFLTVDSVFGRENIDFTQLTGGLRRGY